MRHWSTLAPWQPSEGCRFVSPEGLNDEERRLLAWSDIGGGPKSEPRHNRGG